MNTSISNPATPAEARTLVVVTVIQRATVMAAVVISRSTDVYAGFVVCSDRTCCRGVVLWMTIKLAVTIKQIKTLNIKIACINRNARVS